MLRRGHGDNVASMAWNRHAIAQTQLRKHVASMGVGRPKFDSTQVWPNCRTGNTSMLCFLVDKIAEKALDLSLLRTPARGTIG